MKWGVRRYQNKDGSLTAAGKAKYIDSSTGGLTSAGKNAYTKAYATKQNSLLSSKVRSSSKTMSELSKASSATSSGGRGTALAKGLASVAISAIGLTTITALSRNSSIPTEAAVAAMLATAGVTVISASKLLNSAKYDWVAAEDED